jgi:prefoldin subunit 5
VTEGYQNPAPVDDSVYEEAAKRIQEYIKLLRKRENGAKKKVRAKAKKARQAQRQARKVTRKAS